MKASPEKLATLAKRYRKDRIHEGTRQLARGRSPQLVLEYVEAMIAIDDLLLLFAKRDTSEADPIHVRTTDLRYRAATHIEVATAILTEGQAIRRIRRAAAEFRALYARALKKPTRATAEAA